MSRDYQPMTPPPVGPSPRLRRMDVFIPLALVAGWIALQTWILPRTGNGT